MNELRELEKQIKQFETFKEKIERQQLSNPLDLVSQNNIKKDIVVVNGDSLVPASLGTYEDGIEIDLNGKKYLLETTAPY